MAGIGEDFCKYSGKIKCFQKIVFKKIREYFLEKYEDVLGKFMQHFRKYLNKFKDLKKFFTHWVKISEIFWNNFFGKFREGECFVKVLGAVRRHFKKFKCIL